MKPSTPAYVVVSPVRDEEQYIETTLQSMVSQTLKPARWIVVDDGSADRTAEIVERYTREHSWISLVRLPRQAKRNVGSPVVRAFNTGVEQVEQGTFDFVVKLDCDLRISPEYFERIFRRFQQDPKLGIASGVYLELQDTKWQPVPMPDYHAAGACKVIRARCFEEIGGFVVSRGWDTVDEIRAQTLGWRTLHFPDITFDHLKPEGSSRGSLYTSRLHGEVYYLTGGSLSFFLLKVAHRIVAGRPSLLAGLMLLAGYIKPLILRRERLVTKPEALFYKRTLQKRVRNVCAGASAWLGLKSSSGRQI